MNRGFTVVEILVTLVVMAILLGLGTVGLRGSLANGRDSERKSDIEAISHSLETRYDHGYTYSWKEDVAGVPTTKYATVNSGSYPGNNELWDSFFWSERSRAVDVLPGISDAAIMSPGGLKLDAACFFYMFSSEQPRCDAAEKDTTIQGYFDDGNAGWKDKYLYEFIGPDGGYCNIDECVRYNLYWISETDKTVFKGIPGLKVLRSRHQ